MKDSDYLKKEVSPVLILNSRLRLRSAELDDIDSAERLSWNFTQKLIEAGTNDEYNRSFFAMWHQVLKRRQRKEDRAKQLRDQASNEQANVKQKESEGDVNRATTELIYMKIDRDQKVKQAKKMRR